MTAVAVGLWVARWKGDERITKYHLTESVVAGAAFTACGLRMEPVVHGRDLRVEATMPLTRAIDQPQLCHHGCYAGDS